MGIPKSSPRPTRKSNSDITYDAIEREARMARQADDSPYDRSGKDGGQSRSFFDGGEPIRAKPVTETTIERAQRTVCAFSIDADEADSMMRMLGIHPDDIQIDMTTGNSTMDRYDA